MKMFYTFLVLLSVAVLSAAVYVPELMAQENAGFGVGRFVVCSGIADREPTDVASTFPAGTEKVYAYLEATDIASDTTVDIVWLRDGSEVGRVPLKLGAGHRWRTFSSKKVQGMGGNWRVEVQAPDGKAVASVDFTVQ